VVTLGTGWTDRSGNAPAAPVLSQSFSVDTLAPTIQAVALTADSEPVFPVLNADDKVTVSVAFSEAVNVVLPAGQSPARPAIGLMVGSQPVQASYVSGSGTNTLSFEYTIGAGQNDTDGIAIPAAALVLPEGASIRDARGNDAVLAHSGSVANSEYRVDADAPVLSVPVSPMLLTADSSVLSGTAEPFAQITVSREGVPLSNLAIAADAGGVWSVTAAQLGLNSVNSSASFSFEAIDVAGNESSSQSRLLLRIGSIEQAPADAVVDRSILNTPDTVKVGAGDGIYRLGGGDDVLIGIPSGDPGFAGLGDNQFLGGSGNDRFIDIGLDDLFVGGEGVDAAVLQGVRPTSIQVGSTPEIDATARAATGTAGSFLRVESASGQFFYLSEVEYLEFAGDGTRIDLQSLYGQYTQAVL